MKCPHCNGVITSINISDLDGKVKGQSLWRCIGYSCPLCAKTLSVEIDPIALKAQILAELVNLLRKP